MRIFFIVSVLLISLSVNATDYYFSSSSGADSRSAAEAQNPQTPWKSLEKLNAVISNLTAGDNVFFKRGDTFFGSIQINRSGAGGRPIGFFAYGNGNKPIITGFSALSNWSQVKQNVWEGTSSSLGAVVNFVLVNGVPKRIGRYPNATESNAGYLNFENPVANISIRANLPGGNNLTGGEVVIRKNRWVVDRNTITSQVGSLITYASQSGYYADPGYGFFIQNHIGTLDQEGEWYYRSSDKKLGIYTSGGSGSLQNVVASTINVLVSINNQSNLVFENIVFTGSTANTFFIKNAQNIRLNNCELNFAGGNAITADNVNALTIENSAFNYTNNIAFNGVYCTNALLKNNTVNCTGIFAGMGDGDSGSYEALMIAGDNNVIELNKIDSTGYIPVTFSGNNVTVKNNYISNYAFVKDDGGAIYTWNNGSNAPANYGRKITGNIVTRGLGASEGTSNTAARYANGIYIDDNASNVEVSANTVANCEGFGIYVHNARDLAITNNTVYNNQVQLSMIQDDIAPNSKVRNNSVSGNILFSLSAVQPVAEYKSNNDDVAQFGNFDNNYYCRPVDDNAVINTLKRVNGSYIFNQLDLDAWKDMYGKDGNSKKTAKQFSEFATDQISTSNQFGNGAFNNDIGGLYSYSSANNCTTQWNNNAIDGGSLQVSFSSQAGNNNKGTIIINVGAVSANKTYVLRLSAKGDGGKMLEAYLRKSFSPYSDLTDRKLAKVKSLRSDIEFIFKPTESEANASIGLDIPEQNSPVYIDNIQLLEAVVHKINISDSVRFIYNADNAANSYNLSYNSIDVKNTSYNNSISIEPFSSAILLSQTKNVVATPVPVQCSATGNISYDIWTNVSGNNVSDNNYLNAPNSSKTLTAFEAPENSGDNFASRIRGYICPPQSGNYTFWIAGDDGTELWLSSDANPSNKTKVAYSLSYTGFRDWNAFATQKSAQVYLVAGTKYFIEALHKEGGGGDHLSVKWQLPDGTVEAPIPGARLSPYATVQSPAVSQTINFAAPADVSFGVEPFALAATASSGLPVSFRLVSGPATISGNTITVTAAGVVTVEATQPGNASFNAAAAVQRSFTVLSPVAVQCSATGNISYDTWTNVGGNNVSDNNFSNTPNSSKTLTVFEAPQNIADNYASRIRGYICAPQSGNYTFWIAGDDGTELWLSTDANPANKNKIAFGLSYTDFRDWNRFNTQKSASISLVAGVKYYIEALQKEGIGGDHLSVKWQLPDGTAEVPIPGARLSPYISVQNAAVDQTINFATPADVNFGAAPFALSATASSGLPVSFRLVSGPATIAGNTITVTAAGVVTVEATQAGNASFNAASAVQKSFTVLSPVAVQCSATGNISYDTWTNVSGNNVSDNNFSNAPNSSKTLPVFEAPQNIGDNYASRIRGYICPPQSGNYTFWISGDDGTELWLSTDANPANRNKIAYSLSYTGFRDWNAFASQKSAQVYLVAGTKYYVEALQKEGGGGDHLSVSWRLPDGTVEAPIAGARLAPYATVPNLPSDQTINFTTPVDVNFGAAPFALSATASSGLPVSFRIVSGPATISGNMITVTGAGVVTIEASQPGNASFNAAATVQKSFTVLSLVASQCSATGNISYDLWTNVGGNNISDNNFSNIPNSSKTLGSFEAPENIGDNYATRIRGYICPPQSGNYIFGIAGDDATELYISTDANPANKIKIAYSVSYTGFREWNKFNTQRSVPVYLEAGTKYYVEALQKEGGGGDHLSVAWQLPGGAIEAPIPGARLSPYTGNTAYTSAKLAISEAEPEAKASGTQVLNVRLQVYPNPVSSVANITVVPVESGIGSIKVFDLLNHQVGTIAQEYMEKNQSKTWRYNFNKLPNGIYLVRFAEGNHFVSKKIIVTR